MAQAEPIKKVEAAPAAPPAAAEVKPVAAPPAAEEKTKLADDSKALAVVETSTPDTASKKTTTKGGSLDRDIALSELEKEKRSSFIKAWEESEKSKADNKAQKKLSAVTAWENSKKAAIEAQLKKIEEELEKKKAEYAEKMKNKIAMVHKQAQEKKAMIEAQHGEELLKADEIGAKYRATGTVPKPLCGCF
ncbi:hypothetical protein ACFE04_026362 [Oxalis oulophora]